MLPKIVKRNPKRTVAVLLLCLIVGYSAWRMQSQPKPPSYLTAPVVRVNLEDAVLATGTLQPVRQVDVGAQVSGQLTSLKVEAGDKVKKGQLLAILDPELAQNDLKSSQAQLDNLIAQREGTRANLAQAQRELTRQQKMHVDEASAQKDLEAAQTQLAVLQAQLQALDAQIRQSQFLVDRNRTNLAYTQITAPIDGDVVSIVTQEGQTVISTQQAPTILRLADLSTMTVRAQIAEADVIRIRQGLPVYFTVLGAPDTRYWGKLRTILPTPDKINNAVFYNALFDVPNPKGVLRVDMTAQVGIVLSQADNALAIPLSALGAVHKDGRYTVRVLGKDQQVVERAVKIGLKTVTQVQVLAGLNAGEQVITSDSSKLDNKDAKPEDKA